MRGGHADGNLVAKIRFSSFVVCVSYTQEDERKDYKGKNTRESLASRRKKKDILCVRMPKRNASMSCLVDIYSPL